MKHFITSSLAAVAMLVPAAAVQAHETPSPYPVSPDGHAPAGVMADHVHKAGDIMIGGIWTRERFTGSNYTGNRKASDAELVAAGYTVREKAMTMDMVMGHLMWAPTNDVTLMVMPMWMRMEMDMLGIGNPHMGHGEEGGHGGHGGHGLMPGQTMKHTISGMGDTKVGPLFSLSRKPALSAHAGLMLSIPTGSVSRKGHDGKFTHYGMQPGSGTWDIEPSLTLLGKNETLSWGVQASYLHRMESANKSGYRLGNVFSSTAWVAKAITPRLSVSARLAYRDQGIIKGHYNGPHNHNSPPDLQGNYGGQRLEAGAGANFVIGQGLRVGAEVMVPVHQKVNGYQLRKDTGLNLSISHAF